MRAPRGNQGRAVMLRAWHAACFEIGVADGETFLELESLIALAESNSRCRRVQTRTARQLFQQSKQKNLNP